jgi:hypothetical protein
MTVIEACIVNRGGQLICNNRAGKRLQRAAATGHSPPRLSGAQDSGPPPPRSMCGSWLVWTPAPVQPPLAESLWNAGAVALSKAAFLV